MLTSDVLLGGAMATPQRHFESFLPNFDILILHGIELVADRVPPFAQVEARACMPAVREGITIAL